MATAIKLKSDIKKLKKAIETKGISDSIKSKLRVQLEKVENELAAMQKGGKPKKVSSTKSTATALTALQKLIKRKKYATYQGKKIDLKKDAGEGAMATGRRVSKGLKANQFGSKGENKGNVYYEYRPNRLDVKQPKKAQRYPKLEDGGMMADGGEIEDKFKGKNSKEIWNNLDSSTKAKVLEHLFLKGNTSGVQYYDSYNTLNELSYSDWDKLPKNIKNEIDNFGDKDKMADGGYMAKGGGISKLSTYVSNRNINELSVILKGNLKTLKGSDILDGVYVKNSALTKIKAKVAARKSAGATISSDDAYDKLVAKAKKYDLDKEDIDAIKKDDVKKLVDVGYDLEDLRLIYFGVKDVFTSNIDDEISSISGVLSYTSDAIPNKIQTLVKAAKENKFELGLKYPDFNWSDIVKKYNISKDGIEIDGTESAYTDEKTYYVYTIFKGNKIVLGTATDRVRKFPNGKVEKGDSFYSKDKDELAKFQGGYWGVVSSSKEVIKDIAKMILTKKAGYIKDMDIFFNALGGVDADDLDLNKVKYEEGGMMEDDNMEDDYSNPSEKKKLEDGGVISKTHRMS